jgi:hypothetical protein
MSFGFSNKEEERKMKKTLFVSFAVVITMLMVSLSFADEGNKMMLKAGDEIYVCNCPPGCPCDGMSRNPGKCTCGTDMVKAKVTKVETGKANFMASGWDKERTYKTVGKYACNCPPGCKCNTISQNPGKCTCGAEMKEAKK